MSELHDRIVKALRTVHDPEIPINLYDLGLIYKIDIADDAQVRITMTLTTPNCPVAEQIPASVETAVRGVEGVAGVEVSLVWDPKWSTEMMSEAAKLELEFTGHTGPAHLRPTRSASLTVGRKKPGDRRR